MTINYLGTPGSGLGFQLAGVNVVDCNNSEEMLQRLGEIRDQGGGIAFVDEGLAEEVLAEVEQMNQATMLTVVLLSNPAEPKRLAATKMNRLMVQAIGSDIFNK